MAWTLGGCCGRFGAWMFGDCCTGFPAVVSSPSGLSRNATSLRLVVPWTLVPWTDFFPGFGFGFISNPFLLVVEKLGKLLVSPSLPNVATRVFDVVFTTLIFLFRPFFIPPLLPAALVCCLFSSVVRPHRLSGSFRNIMFLICVPPISSRSP